jgi:hypothetical protein
MFCEYLNTLITLGKEKYYGKKIVIILDNLRSHKTVPVLKVI